MMMKNEQLVIDGEPVLGPHGTRALCTALMGNAPGMSGRGLQDGQELRFWRMDCSDDGAACLAEILRLGGAELPMAYLEMLDCGVGYRERARIRSVIDVRPEPVAAYFKTGL